MFSAGLGVVWPGGVNKAMFALLMIDTLVCACRYIRLMYWPRWNSPRSVVAGPGLAGSQDRAAPGSRESTGCPTRRWPQDFRLCRCSGCRTVWFGLGKNPAPVETDPGPCASALNPCGLFVLERTMWV